MNFSSLPKIQRTTWHYLFSKSFGNIISLTLAYTTVGNEALIAFSKICKPLLRIDLSYCPNITDAGIKPVIEKSKDLFILKINGTNIESIDFLVDTMEICQELQVLEAKNIQFRYSDNGAALNMINALCRFAPWLKQLELDMFSQPSNTALLKSKMKIVSKNVQNNYGNIAFGLPSSSIKQSSYNVDKSRDGSLAVDGRMSSRFGEAWCDHTATTTMTGVDIEAFLDLDLDRAYNVSEIFVKLPDDRHGTKAQFPIYLFTALRPFKRSVEEVLKMEYLVTSDFFEEPVVGFRVKINKKVRYVRVQQACNKNNGYPRCLSVAQVVVLRDFKFLTYLSNLPENKETSESAPRANLPK
eukprot:g8595.t1